MDTFRPSRRALLITGAALLAAAPFAPLMAQTASEAIASTGVASAGVASAAAQPALAVVQMLNTSTVDPKKKMVFEPAIVRVPVGGTVRFEAVNPGHNAAAFKGMVPEGAEPFKTAIGKTTEVVFTEPGVYGYGCTPHQSMGMVGLIVVGDPVNLDAAKAVKHRGKVKEAFDALFTEMDATITTN